MNKKSPSSAQEIEVFTAEFSEWNYNSDSLQATYTCSSFEEAISLLNQTVNIFSEVDHHPTIENTYNKLSFTLTTHDAGNKVTGIDIAVAKRISETATAVS
jgi:4a-hydroxytetrahydrobiopterin dehydratase